MAAIAAHPSVTLQRELNRQMKSAQSIHEGNYTLIVSSVLIALSLTALLWLVVNVSTTSHAHNSVIHSLPRDVINPTADIAESSVSPHFPALSVMK
ncbi:MAG: hypothetical protein P4L53_19715 [Candidatus Obscuribacterales bacterium]|nr:hypothetical protein [Candidatus Obscuribacterales bacterium]